MGKYTFTWEHSAEDVFVTGTFDDWRKTVQLEKHDGVFQKSVELPKTHTQYKFVVDGTWCINDSARKEDDGNGIVNNVLLPEDIVDPPLATLSSAAPASSTAELAAAVPKEASESSLPGTFPMTPPAETPGSEAQAFAIAPLPATSGLGNPIHLAPGEPVPHPTTLTDSTVDSTVQLQPQPEAEATTFGVAPIPATAGLGNPIRLAPGEPVPHPNTLTDNTVHTTATTDPASYDKSDALPPLAFTPQAERDAKGGMFGLPPVLGNMIPESSLPMGVDAKVEQDTGVTIQSAAPTSTTAALAAQVPVEPHAVPEAVTESQHEAGVAPEAAANPEAVQEKKEVEEELKAKVPEVPAAADNSYLSSISSSLGAAAATAAAGVTAGAGLVAAAAYAAKDKASEATGIDENTTATEIQKKAADTATDLSITAAVVQAKAADALGLNGSAAPATDLKDKAAELDSSTAAGEVPVVVAESQKEAHVSPEAASHDEAVREKSEVEQELLSEVPKTNESGEPAPAVAVPEIVSESQKEAHVSPEAAANSEAVTEKKAVESELLEKLPQSDETGESAPMLAGAALASHSDEPARDVPEVVAESQKEAHASPEAAANAEAVSEKAAVESELLREIPKSNEAGEPAPAITAATSAVAPGTQSQSETEVVAQEVPEVVAESQKEAHASPEAAANSVAVLEKKAVETELVQEVKATEASGEPAPVAAIEATGESALVDAKPLSSSSEPDAPNAPASEPARLDNTKPIDANTDVAFASQAPTTTEQTTTTEATSSAPAPAPQASQNDNRKDSDVSPKGTPASQSVASGVDDKKKKRRSIFGKIKDKLTSKN